MAWIILIVEDYTMDNGTIIALIGLAGSILAIAGGVWTQVVQFKKDAQRIDGVNKATAEVKKDTSEMIPRIRNIETCTNIIKDDITRQILPQVREISNISGGLSELIEAKRIEDAIKQRVTVSLDNPDYIHNAIKLVYENNAALNVRVQELTNENNVLRAENIRISYENNKLKQRNQELSEQVHQLNRELYPDMGRSL